MLFNCFPKYQHTAEKSFNVDSVGSVQLVAKETRSFSGYVLEYVLVTGSPSASIGSSTIIHTHDVDQSTSVATV
jgi:hypothetical protein